MEMATDKEKALTSQGFFFESWRREPESNRPKRLCRPLHNRFAIAPEAGTTSNIPSLAKLTHINTLSRATKQKGKLGFPFLLERETRLELATSTLARLRSTS
ncbi:MAG: hypothetical protein JWQ50_8109 [Caballeronia mineralivorans]|jgi:hypothetical protein|nr:hypothetical protein [Caballeronia mineralivorans]MEA3104793.1 hypothetical protein [Caballeronia mineralivorans]